MSRSVSLVLPALDTRELLEANLPALLAECDRRGLDDEVLVVDDTGTGSLAAWLAERFPRVRTVTRDTNGGFARALTSGVEAARHAVVFSLNTDVRVRPGCLDALVERLEDPTVLAVSPRVLLDGREDAVESWTHVGWREGEVRLERPDASRATEPEGTHAVPFGVGGTLAFRRDEFLDDGFDPLFEPFYLEDVDWCWSGWARGRTVLVEPTAVVEHHHRGTIGARVDRAVVRAAIERNKLLFTWKHLDDPELLEEHLRALARKASNAWISEERDELIWLLLALEERAAAVRARAGRSPAARSFSEVLERSEADGRRPDDAP